MPSADFTTALTLSADSPNAGQQVKNLLAMTSTFVVANVRAEFRTDLYIRTENPTTGDLARGRYRR
jgi:hypothetical protein